MTAQRGIVVGRDALVCGTGYTGEDGVELLVDPDDAPAMWDEIVRRGAVRPGLAARDTLRLEACFHLYGNDLSRDRNPIEAGLGWACKEATGFIGAEAVAAARAAGPAEKLVPFKLTGPGIARQGNPVVGGGEVTSGTLSPCLGIGIGHGVRAGGASRPRARSSRSTSAARRARRSCRRSRSTSKEHRWLRPATRMTCCTTPITTGRRSTARSRRSASRGSRRRPSARSSSSTRPRSASTVTANEFYAEVESVKAVSDVIAPLSGEIVEVNTALADATRRSTRIPTASGWMVKVKLSDPSRVRRPAGPRRLRERPRVSGYTAVTPEDLEIMLGAIGVDLDRAALRRHPRPRCA